MLLSLESASFSITAAYSFVFAVGGAIDLPSLCEIDLLVLSISTKMAYDRREKYLSS